MHITTFSIYLRFIMSINFFVFMPFFLIIDDALLNIGITMLRFNLDYAIATLITLNINICISELPPS